MWDENNQSASIHLSSSIHIYELASNLTNYRRLYIPHWLVDKFLKVRHQRKNFVAVLEKRQNCEPKNKTKRRSWYQNISFAVVVVWSPSESIRMRMNSDCFTKQHNNSRSAYMQWIVSVGSFVCSFVQTTPNISPSFSQQTSLPRLALHAYMCCNRMLKIVGQLRNTPIFFLCRSIRCDTTALLSSVIRSRSILARSIWIAN